MELQPGVLSLIQSSFSGQKELIERAFLEDESFRSLCEDYHECVMVLRRWKQEETAESYLRRREYAELLVDLDREIQTLLEARERGESIEEPPDRSAQDEINRVS